jgi:hypothetical protein
MIKSTVHRPQDLLKMRTAESGGAEPYFGELSLFEEVCPFRTEEAKALKATETLCLKFKKLAEIREFCPEFYDRLYDFCALSGARFGINQLKLSGQKKNASRTYPKINQLCLDMRQELLSRHHQIIQKRQLVCATQLQEGFSRLENDKHEALADGHDEVQFKVLKQLNRLGQKEARLIVLDR